MLAIDGNDVDTCADTLLRGDYDTPEGCLYTGYELALAWPGAPPNRHPNADAIETRTAQGQATKVPRGAELAVPPGESVTFAYVPGQQDAESFMVPVNGGESFETTAESPWTTWFRTGGEFGSDGPLGAKADQIVLTPAPGEPTRIYALVRDGRGGLAWWWADVRGQ